MTKDEENLREATRHAHEAIKDLRDATRDAKAVVKEIQEAAAVNVDGRVHQAIIASLGELESATKEAIDRATASVYERFDRIADILMGETKQDRRVGRPSLPKLAEVMAEGKKQGGH